MLKIRLSRFGRKSRPFYRIVVSDAKRQRDSSFLGEVGKYDPLNNLLTFDIEQYKKYVDNGAQATDTVQQLFNKYKKNQNKSTSTL